MKAAIREILQYVLDHPEMTTRSAVDSYFEQIVWSLEKAEYEKLNEYEEQQFIDQLEVAKGRPPKEP